MRQSLVKIVFYIDVLSTLIFLYGFMASTYYNTVKHVAWLNVYTLSSFMGVMFWAIISMLVITIAVLAIFILVTNNLTNQQCTGLVISLTGNASLIVFAFFLIIPATLMILAVIFIKVTLMSTN